MRPLTVAAMLLVLLAAPAAAQKGRRHGDDAQPKTEQKKQIDEKAYNEALKRIPDPKEKYDPWSGARPSADQKAK